MKDNRKITIILTLLFMIMAVMYCGMYPAVKDYMGVFSESLGDMPISGGDDLDSYVGCLNLELYQIFWILIIGILIGFVAASIISK